MPQRNPDKLVNLRPDDSSEKRSDIQGQSGNSDLASDVQRNTHIDKDLSLITMDFPRPTKLTEIILNIAKWNKYTIIMEPKLDRSIQIFSPSPMPRDDGFKVFLAALQTVGLRAVFMGPNTFKISELAAIKREI